MPAKCKNPLPVFRCGFSELLHDEDMPVICPTCQIIFGYRVSFEDLAERRRHRRPALMAGIEADQGVGEDVAATPMHSDMEIGFGKARALKKPATGFPVRAFKIPA